MWLILNNQIKIILANIEECTRVFCIAGSCHGVFLGFLHTLQFTPQIEDLREDVEYYMENEVWGGGGGYTGSFTTNFAFCKKVVLWATQIPLHYRMITTTLMTKCTRLSESTPLNPSQGNLVWFLSYVIYIIYVCALTAISHSTEIRFQYECVVTPPEPSTSKKKKKVSATTPVISSAPLSPTRSTPTARTTPLSPIRYVWLSFNTRGTFVSHPLYCMKYRYFISVISCLLIKWALAQISPKETAKKGLT